MYIYIISLNYSQNEKYSRQICTEYQDIHLIVNVLFVENLAVFLDNLQKYVVEHATDNDIIRGMRFAYWMTTATNTHSEYVTHCFSTEKKMVSERP